MARVPSLTAEEKARILQALDEDAAFREAIRRLLLEEVQAAMHDLREAIQDIHPLLDRLAVLVREGFETVYKAIHELSVQVQENSRQIAALTERMERVEAQISSLTERMDMLTLQVQENSRHIAALTERMDRVEAQIATLTERVDEVTAQLRETNRQIQENSRQIAALTGEVREQRIRLDDVSGVAVEAGAKEEINIWLQNRKVEIVRKYLPGDLRDHLGVGPIPDGIMLLKNDSGYVFLVYEVPFTIALRDVRRIAEWLEGFRKVKWPAIGLVHYRRALPEEDVEHHVVENGREVIHTVPGMQTVRKEAAQGGVLLMQHGASPWRPEGWQPPKGLEEIPQAFLSLNRW